MRKGALTLNIIDHHNGNNTFVKNINGNTTTMKITTAALLSQELSYLSDALDECAYDVVEKVMREIDKLYVIKCRMEKKSGDEGLLEVGDAFGERAILTKEPRAVMILEMGTTQFNELLGHVLDLVDDKIKGYEPSKAAQNEDERKSAKTLWIERITNSWCS